MSEWELGKRLGIKPIPIERRSDKIEREHSQLLQLCFSYYKLVKDMDECVEDYEMIEAFDYFQMDFEGKFDFFEKFRTTFEEKRIDDVIKKYEKHFYGDDNRIIKDHLKEKY